MSCEFLTSIAHYFPGCHEAAKTSEGAAPEKDPIDQSYSLGTKAAIVGAVALIAIGLVGAALSGMVLFGAIPLATFTMGFVFSLLAADIGLVGGIGLACCIHYLHVQEVADRQFVFPSDEEGVDSYFALTASEGDIEAIKKEYNTGYNLVMDCFLIKNEEERNTQFEKGLKVVESSMLHSGGFNPIEYTYENYLPKQTIKECFESALREMQGTSPEEAKTVFVNHLVTYARTIAGNHAVRVPQYI
jgi:hypothetical protein